MAENNPIDIIKTVKVLIGIPNMGYAHSEAYGNRLMNFMSMGNFMTERQCFYKMVKALREIAPEKADEVMNKYLEGSVHIKKYGEESFQFYFVNVGRIFTPAAREEIAKKALEHDMDYIYMIDDDMIAPDDTFQRLYKHNVDIVSPLAFTRNPPFKPVMYASIDGYDAVAKTDYFINNVVMKYPRNRLVECDATGFGAVLMKTWMLKNIKPPYFMSSEGTGEDILFCYKAKKVGARVFMDTSLKLGHLGNPQIITEEFVDNYRNQVDPQHVQRYPDFTKYEALTLLGD